MLFNYFKTALRALRRRPGYAVLNLAGLAVGMAASLLILTYVTRELGYDAFHADADRIYRVRFDLFRDGERLFKAATTFPAVGPALQQDFPEVETYARLFLRYGGGIVRVEETSYKEALVFHADSSFLTMFSYPWLAGDRATALDAPGSVVLSAATAEKYFGEAHPLGRQVRFGNDETYTVTGVMRSPENSHLKFGLLFSFATLETLPFAREPLQDYAWNWYDFYTYLRLRPGADVAALEARLPDFVERRVSAQARTRQQLTLQPLPRIHLHSDLIQEARTNGDATTVYVLSAIALFILLIAWTNYVNLATARAVERAKEVGVRKTVGAARAELVRQFMLEAALLNAAAVVLSLALLRASLPLFNALTGQALTIHLTSSPVLWTAALVLFALGVLLSGLYPAFVLSAYRPAVVLKGTFARSRGGLALRRSLVVSQFVASVGLVAGTLLVYQQLNHMRSRDLGIAIDQTLVVEAPGVVSDSAGYAVRVERFKQELLRQANVQHVAASTEIPGNLVYWTSGMRPSGAPSEANTTLYQVGVDFDYFETFGHRILAGRGFAPDFPADSGRVVLTEAAVRALGFAGPEDAVGQRIVGGPDTLTVLGVTADYHQEGVHKPFDPIGFRLGTPTARWSYFALALHGTGAERAVENARAAFVRLFPENPFVHYFLDDYFDHQYRTYGRFGRLFGVFAVLAILVACLGLFGLSSLTAEQRTKEIGIRKALGATTAGILVLLSKDFARLVLLGALLAVPLVWYGMDRWLDRFATRIAIRPWVFVLAAALALVVALATVSLQSARAARAAPADSLRYE